jgi:hypothetical protein
MSNDLSSLTTDFEVYEYIKNHLLLQHAKSEIKTHYANGVEVEQGCAYRSDDDKKCAVGCIIADEFYTHSLEGKACHQQDVLNAVQKSVLNWAVNPILLQEMQIIHDEKEVDEWHLFLEDMIRHFPNRNNFVQYPEETEIE